MFKKEIKIHFLLGCDSDFAAWIGDGFCDDANNNEACEFDGGDCHGSNSPPAGKRKSNKLVLTKFKSKEIINVLKLSVKHKGNLLFYGLLLGHWNINILI